jgi:UvrB/uvrC motif
MGLDIGKILEGWEYEPGKVTVRKIRSAEGEEMIQLRLDLGLLQMAVHGRPDGERPHGFESLLDYYEDRLSRWKDEHGSDRGFQLDEQACELLRTEASMYYHRYLAQFVLEEYDSVATDTARNLRLMDFCSAYATEASDQYVMEQYRSYVLMMHTRSRAHAALRDSRPKAALASVKLGIERIRAFYKRFEQEKLADGSAELAVLKALAKEIEARVPTDPLRKLRRSLRRAVAEERYEEAADLRDQIRREVQQRAHKRQDS